MKSGRPPLAAWLCPALLLPVLQLVAPAAETGPAALIQQVQLTGTIVCLHEEMHREFQADLPTEHAHVLACRTDTGKYYTLLRTKMSEALFTDERLRQKTLVLKGRVFPGSQLLEITGNLQTIKDNRVHELYYYCDICVINTISPAPCLCCQGPVELKEVPAE